MKPRTKKEMEVWNLLKKLPPITDKQRIYAEKHCFEGVGYKNGKLVWCTKCGCEFGLDMSDLGVSLGVGDKATCPVCGEELKVKVSTKRKIDEKRYYTIVTTIVGWQVLRHFIIKKYMVRVSKYIHGCQKPTFGIHEVVQNWIDDNGKEVIVARPRNSLCGCYDSFCMNKPLEIRKEFRGYSYNPDPYLIYEDTIYPYMSVLPILRRNGFKGELPDVCLKTLMKELLTDSRAETLMKAGQFKVLEGLCHIGGVAHWKSVLICIRNKYMISDVNIWNDMVDALEYLGKDTHNAHYVCPENLKESHYYWMKLMSRKKKKIAEEKKRKEELYWESEYRKEKGRFFGIEIKEGNIVVKVIQSVKEMQEEGDVMHHCVANCEYYKRRDSLILSAKDKKGKRLETIEVNLRTFKVVQCFGVCNSKTEYHGEILDVMNRNMNKIRDKAGVLEG